MSDIATLGIRVETGQVASASSALDHLAAIARSTAQTVVLLEKAAKSANTAIAAVESTATDAKSAMAGFEKALSGAVSAIRDMSSVGQRGLDQLRAKFNPLFAASQEYKQRLGDIRDAHRIGALSAKEMAEAIERTKIAFIGQVAAIKGTNDTLAGLNARSSVATSSMRNLTKQVGLAQHELVNLGRQGQDVITMLAMGASPMQVFTSQFAQIYDVFKSSKGSAADIKAQLLGMITPMRVLGVLAVAAGVGAAFMFSNWKRFTLQMDDMTRAAGTTTASMSRLQAAASFKGINADEFAAGMSQFSKSVYEAKNNMGGLAEVFRANGVAAKDFDGYLEKAADLIKRASSDQQRLVLLQQMGLPATMEWVRLLQGGAEGIRRAKDAAVDFTANDKMVQRAREFDEAWNRAWTNFTRGAKAGMQAALETGSAAYAAAARINPNVKAATALSRNPTRDYIGSQFKDAVANNRGVRSGAGSSVDRFYDFSSKFRDPNGTPEGPSQPTVDPQKAQHDIQIAQQRLALLGSTMTATEAMRQIDLQAQAARLQGVPIDEKRLEILKRLAAEQTNGVAAIRQQTEAVRLETATIGMSAGEAARYTVVQQALNKAKAEGRVNSETDLANINAEAAALGRAAEAADQRRTQFALYNEVISSGSSTITTGLADILDGTKTASQGFADMGKSILRSLTEMIIKMTITIPIARALQSALGGFLPGTSAATGVTGGMGSGLSIPTFGAGVNHTGYGPGDSFPTRSVSSAAFRGAPKFHSGIGPGERAAIIRNDESVLTPGQMRALGPRNSRPVTVVNRTEIINQTGARVEQREESDGQGGRKQVYVISEMVAAAQRTPGAAAYRQPPLTRR